MKVTGQSLTVEQLTQLRDSLAGKPTVAAPLMALASVGSRVNGEVITQSHIDSAREWCAEILNRRVQRSITTTPKETL